MQKFKGDALEEKFFTSGALAIDAQSNLKSEFYATAFDCFVLGDILWESERAPLSTAIAKNIFREAFASIFEAFIAGGSFESYLTVFRNIFGESVVVNFTVPAPGKLNIDIESDGVELFEALARSIDGGSYVYDELIDDEGANIMFQGLKGFETQYEVEQMLFEMVPAGIFTAITLSVGGE